MELNSSEMELLTDEFGLDVREDYSGRGMMGATTKAIVADSKDYVISMLSEHIQDALCDGDTGRADELNTIISKVAKANQDSLGKHDIVIY